jgi:hypothetical protein
MWARQGTKAASSSNAMAAPTLPWQPARPTCITATIRANVLPCTPEGQARLTRRISWGITHVPGKAVRAQSAGQCGRHAARGAFAPQQIQASCSLRSAGYGCGAVEQPADAKPGGLSSGRSMATRTVAGSGPSRPRARAVRALGSPPLRFLPTYARLSHRATDGRAPGRPAPGRAARQEESRAGSASACQCPLVLSCHVRVSRAATGRDRSATPSPRPSRGIAAPVGARVGHPRGPHPRFSPTQEDWVRVVLQRRRHRQSRGIVVAFRQGLRGRSGNAPRDGGMGRQPLGGVSWRRSSHRTRP